MVIEYRKAKEEHAKLILELIAPFVATKAVLPRTQEDIIANVMNFFVAVDTELERVVGCVALRNFGEGLEEVRTLCVDPNYSNYGVASKLIDCCLKLAQERESTEVFALSLRPNLFRRKGFSLVDMASLPERVWKDDQVSSPDEKAVILVGCDDFIHEQY